MSMSFMEELGGMDELLAEVYREFREGLPERLAQLREALDALADGYEPGATEVFYRTAHSLKGAAPSFGAGQLVDPAAALAETGRRWYEGGFVDGEELRTAIEELGRLDDAVGRYMREMEGGAGG
ncbi:MAG: Hpt domain-containing protein [Gemmatimonadales bacterium]|jgi:HPt (histidine-containing phosphotransfer) domain-containing protein